MDRIFGPLKDRYPGCIFVYMDDILIATNDNEELHKRIVHEVLDLVKREDFFLKLNKCLFHQRSIDYLGIRIEGGRISIDPTKLDGLAHWKEELRNVHEVRSMLRFYPILTPYQPLINPLSTPCYPLSLTDLSLLTSYPSLWPVTIMVYCLPHFFTHLSCAYVSFSFLLPS
jgi:hypothetical protein